MFWYLVCSVLFLKKRSSSNFIAFRFNQFETMEPRNLRFEDNITFRTVRKFKRNVVDKIIFFKNYVAPFMGCIVNRCRCF